MVSACSTSAPGAPGQMEHPMKLKTPTFPRKGHHDAPSRPPVTPVQPAPVATAAAATPPPPTPASALKKVAGGLATPARQRNTAAMIAGLAFIIIAGAIGASVASSFDDSIEVLVAARDIEEGQPISADDFRTVQIAAAAGDIEVLAPSSIDELVGRVAAGPIGQGSMIHPDQFALAYGEQRILVGAALGPDQYPAGGLRAGDQVRIIATSGRSFSSRDDDGLTAGQEVAVGEVVDVVSLSSNNLHFSIRVPESTANIVVQLVSSGQVSLGLLDDGVALDSVPALPPGQTFEPETVAEEPGE